ncbi:MAG TPA: response regulator [Verrucomicrobiae bacterium]|nr:response regulator [Verrucomicrobiae bacterium]
MPNPHPTRAQPDTVVPPLVYVVDDEPMLLDLASVILESAGYGVCVFRDPLAALDSFERAQPRPDLVITDYAMPPINGMELIERCRQIEPAQRILLISGTVGSDIFDGAIVRPDRFLAKPYQASDLIEVVKEILSS